MNGRQAVVLSVEDEKESVAGTLEGLKFHGLVVVEAKDIADAIRLLSDRPFDLLLVDLRLPRSGTFRFDGGVELIEDIATGRVKCVNPAAPAVLLTAYPTNHVLHRLENCSNFVTVVDKVASPTLQLLDICRERLWSGAVIDPARLHSPRVAETLISILDGPDDQDRYHVHLSSWEIADSVWIRLDHLLPDVQQELEFGNRPVHLWCTLDLSATTPEGLQPHNFKIGRRSTRGQSDYMGRGVR